MGCLSYLYAQELFTSKHQFIIGTLMNTSTGIVMIVVTMYFMTISKDWHYLYVLIALLKIIANFIIYKLPESPKYLIEKKEYFKAFNSLNSIAYYNRNPPLISLDQVIYKDHEQSTSETKESFSANQEPLIQDKSVA